MLPIFAQAFFVVILLMFLPMVGATMVEAFCADAVSGAWSCPPLFVLCAMAGDLQWLPGQTRNQASGATGSQKGGSSPPTGQMHLFGFHGQSRLAEVDRGELAEVWDFRLNVNRQVAQLHYRRV